MSSWLYGESDPSELDADQKETISAIISLGAIAVTSATGGSTTDIVASDAASSVAVEDNSMVPGAPYIRWLVLLGDASIKDLIVQDAKQDARIMELTAEKLKERGEEAVEIIEDLPETIAYLYENPKLILELPEAVQKAIVDYIDRLKDNIGAIGDGLVTNDLNILEKQTQAESDLLADLAEGLLGAGVGKVVVSGGKVIVKSVGETIDNITNPNITKYAGRVDPTTGEPMLDMSELTNNQKGIMGELFGEDLAKQIIPDGEKLTSVSTVGSKGIDDLYKVDNPDIDYVVIEYKFNTSKQGMTNDGLQASESWITGSNRLENAVGDEMIAKDIRNSIDAGRTETWLIKVMPDGSSTIKVLDGSGKPKPVDTSKIILPNKSYNGAQL